MFSIGGTTEYTTGSTRSRGSSTSSTRRNVSEEGINKILQDVLASDAGLAKLAEGENISGGSGSTVKSQFAQDLVTKLAGELALINAETITTASQEGYEKNKNFGQSVTGSYGSKGTVICTELVRQGKLDKDLYEAGNNHFQSLHSLTIKGYQSWARKVVPLMQKSERLSNFLLPIALARYNHITGKKKNLGGWLTVFVAQPVCYVIGYVIEVLHGYRLIEHA